MFESIDHLPKSTKASLPDESKEKKINLLPEDLRLDKNDKLKIKQLKKDTHFNYSQDGKRMQSLLNKLINAVKSKFARPPQAPAPRSSRAAISNAMSVSAINPHGHIALPLRYPH